MRLPLLAALLPALALAEAPKDLAAWEDARQFDCNAPFENFAPPDVKDLGAFRYEHSGGTVKVRRLAPRATKVARLGLLSGIKDLDPETKDAVAAFLTAFEKADVDVVIIGGDTAEDPAVLEQVIDWLAETSKRPLVAIAGNTERAASLNYAILKARKAGATHLVNMDLVRRYDGEGFDLVSVAGYHDRRYLHATGACIYTEQHLEAAASAAASADDPVVLLAHGPPRMKGQKAIDYVPGADNVGDPRLTDLVRTSKIAFGVFGHILEAGGSASDLAGHPLPQKKLQPQLYVCQGSANPLPWKLNDGSTSYGLAAIMTIDGKKASYEVLRAPKPTPKVVP